MENSLPGTSLPRQPRAESRALYGGTPLAEAAAKALSACSAALWLLDEAGANLAFASGYGSPPASSWKDLIPLTERSLQRDALASATAAVEDASSDPQGAELSSGHAAALCVRLGSIERPIGILCVYDVQPRRFTAAEVELLQVIANLGTLTFEAAQRSADLERAEAERARLSQVTTHELRSPITIAQSLLNSLVKGYAGRLTDQQRDVLTRIASQLDFLSHMVNDFLDLSATKAAGSTTEEGAVVVNSAVARVALILQPRAEEREVALSLRPCREELAVWASEEDLDRIFHNLMENAVKYTPAGGRVIVSLARSGDEAQVTVTDTGIGIPEDAQAHLFEEFYRAPNARIYNAVGTGLGLAIVKGLVDRYRGRIMVQSSSGKGTTFTVFLPLHRERAGTSHQVTQ